MGYALITGASSGIGFELAKIFAELGNDIIMVSSNGEKLISAVKKVCAASSCSVKYYAADLSGRGSAEELYKRVSSDGLCVDILVNNAGVGMTGNFLSFDSKKESAMLELNINSLVTLTRLFAKDMSSGGRILNVSSTGAFQSGAYISTYYASKAFVDSFSQAIRSELMPCGITVSTLYPGATRTDFSRRAGKSNSKSAMSPESVALSAYRGMMRGKAKIIPGAANNLMLLIPKGIRSWLIGKMQKSLMEEKAI